MGDSKLVSVSIPNYNNPVKYLVQSIRSAAYQTINPADMEIVIVDDHSSEEGKEGLMLAVDAVKKEYPSVEISVYSNNLQKGLGNARNTGVIKSRGKYVLSIDSDDMISECAVEKGLMKHEENQYDLVFSDLLKMDESMDEIIHRRKRSEIFEMHKNYKGTLLDPLVHGSFAEGFEMLKRESAVSAAYRNISCPDYDMHLRISSMSSDVNFGHIPEDIYFYRNNPDSMSNKDNQDNAIKIVQNYLLEFLESKGFQNMDEVVYLHRPQDPHGPFFYDIIVDGKPVEVPWFDKEGLDWNFTYSSSPS